MDDQVGCSLSRSKRTKLTRGRFCMQKKLTKAPAKFGGHKSVKETEFVVHGEVCRLSGRGSAGSRNGFETSLGIVEGVGQTFSLVFDRRAVLIWLVAAVDEEIGIPECC